MKRFAMMGLGAMTALLFVLSVLALGCTSLKKGECRKDLHCSDMSDNPADVWVCYKEPPQAQMGKCMRVKDAIRAREAFENKQR